MTEPVLKSRRPEYQRWQQIKQRCGNPKSRNYKRYGGRGIKVCERWRSDFTAFFEAIGTAPSGGFSIDRKDNNGHYSCGECEECLTNGWPMNIKWATRREQQTNMRSNVKITHNGETLCISEWARRATVPISASALWRRIFASKWDMEKALSTPTNQDNEVKERRDRVRITIDGTSYYAKDWARISGIPYGTVYRNAKRQLSQTKA